MSRIPEPSGVNWVESAGGLKWIGYIPGLGKKTYIAIVKDGSHGWHVTFDDRHMIRIYGTEYVAKMAATSLAIECLTEALINLNKEKEYGPSS